MAHGKLILIDGISGLGKSTSAQFLARQLEANGIPAKWYHEEEVGHPLASQFDVEAIRGQEVEQFVLETPILWRALVEKAQIDGKVHIIESILLQDTARILFQNNVAPERIQSFILQLMEIVRPMNPKLIYLYQADVEASIRRIWQRRGERWKQWFVESDSATPYAQALAGSDDLKAIGIWRDYQSFALDLVQTLGLPSLLIDNTAGHWDVYLKEMTDFLSISLVEQRTESSAYEEFCGSFRGMSRSGREMTCTIRQAGDRLRVDANFLWPDMGLLPYGPDELVVESLPLRFLFSRNEAGVVTSIKLQGENRSAGAELHKTHSPG